MWPTDEPAPDELPSSWCVALGLPCTPSLLAEDMYTREWVCIHVCVCVWVWVWVWVCTCNIFQAFGGGGGGGGGGEREIPPTSN